jgi:prepilin-type N-terminal cleavage/methylation domain-containing protein
MRERHEMKTRTGKRGFTLIEVLASMAVLVVLILALTRMFVQAASITRSGLTAVERNSAGETALETLLQDTEGMVVNERLACYVEADATDPGGFGFDEVWFITTSGDQDDGRAYQLMHYYVAESVATNSIGAAYMRYMLYREMWIMAVADKYVGDVMGDKIDWWNYGLDTIKAGGFPISDRNLIADNVVRFDVYCLGWDGKDWMGQDAGLQVFDSTAGPPGLSQYKNNPPAAFDVYLQITSPEVAVESGMALVPGAGVPADVQAKARAMMIRESSSLFGRASPIIGAAQYHHPVQHYTDSKD